MSLFDLQYRFFYFFELGGFALVMIALLMLLLWIVVFERYSFLFFAYPAIRRRLLLQWQEQANKKTWSSRKIRESMISEASLSLTAGLPLLKVLVMLAPLLGLLGTVSGMIQVFDTLSVIGTGNARAMAAGISRATVPTMAGMIVALPGLYFYSQLNSRAKREREQLLDTLVFK